MASAWAGLGWVGLPWVGLGRPGVAGAGQRWPGLASDAQPWQGPKMVPEIDPGVLPINGPEKWSREMEKVPS